MIFKLKWEKGALQELSKFEKNISLRIYKKVGELKQGFQSKDVKRLHRSNYFRLRVGNFRVLFSLEGNIITIWKVGHRKSVYKI